MRLYLVFTFIAIGLGFLGFFGLGAGPVGFVLWGLAVVFLLLAVVTYKRRKIIRHQEGKSA